MPTSGCIMLETSSLRCYSAWLNVKSGFFSLAIPRDLYTVCLWKKLPGGGNIYRGKKNCAAKPSIRASERRILWVLLCHQYTLLCSFWWTALAMHCELVGDFFPSRLHAALWDLSHCTLVGSNITGHFFIQKTEVNQIRNLSHCTGKNHTMKGVILC
jgi:hypothetical protein